MNLVDEARLPGVADFVRAQLEPFDTSRVERFRLGATEKCMYRGLCEYPVRARKGSPRLVRGYRIRASAHLDPGRYPYEEAVAVGTEQRPDAHPAWAYVTERTALATPEEMLIFVAGHEAFHFLRHCRQVPGRQGEPGANRYGLAWLAAWREEH